MTEGENPDDEHAQCARSIDQDGNPSAELESMRRTLLQLF